MHITKHETVFTKDPSNKKLNIERSFDAPLAQVWKAWTDAAILDQWWAPRPWKAETKTMNCLEGGHWLYCMVGPANNNHNERHWCRADYKTIDPQKTIVEADHFCDEQGVIDQNMPTMNWKKSFAGAGDTTTVTIEFSFATEAEL